MKGASEHSPVSTKESTGCHLVRRSRRLTAAGGLHEKDFWIGQLVRSTADSVEVDWIIYVIGIFRELVKRPYIFAALFCKVELPYCMAIKTILSSIDQSIVTIDCCSFIIVRG